MSVRNVYLRFDNWDRTKLYRHCLHRRRHSSHRVLHRYMSFFSFLPITLLPSMANGIIGRRPIVTTAHKYESFESIQESYFRLQNEATTTSGTGRSFYLKFATGYTIFLRPWISAHSNIATETKKRPNRRRDKTYFSNGRRFHAAQSISKPEQPFTMTYLAYGQMNSKKKERKKESLLQ